MTCSDSDARAERKTLGQPCIAPASFEDYEYFAHYFARGSNVHPPSNVCSISIEVDRDTLLILYGKPLSIGARRGSQVRPIDSRFLAPKVKNVPPRAKRVWSSTCVFGGPASPRKDSNPHEMIWFKDGMITLATDVHP